MGTRGVPARYGGFETLAEELGARLVQRGHQVDVYARRYFGQEMQPEFEYRGMRVVTLPTARHKYLETPLHALISFLDAFRRRPEVVLLCNAANSPFSFLLRLAAVPLCINVDGIERHRTKWNWLGKLWYRLGEYCSVLFANKIVADAEVISSYYEQRYGISSSVIAYGADAVRREAGQTLSQFKLLPHKYILYVSRLEPENNALGVIQAYNMLVAKGLGHMPLVIVGDAPYAKEYIANLRRVASANVIFTGFQFGEAYQELRSQCYFYIQATEVGGTHPALVEAMAYSNCVLANDTPEHREVLGDAGLYYRKNDFTELAKLMEKLLSDLALVQALGQSAKERANSLFSWEMIVDKYEALFLQFAKSGR